MANATKKIRGEGEGGVSHKQPQLGKCTMKLAIGCTIWLAICGCRRSVLMSFKWPEEVAGPTAVSVEKHANRVILRAWREGEKHFEVEVARDIELGRVTVLQNIRGTSVLIANDGVVLGGINYKTGETWGRGNYERLPHLTVREAEGDYFKKVMAKQIEPRGTLPAGHPLVSGP